MDNLYENGFPRDCDPYLAVKEAADEIERLEAVLAAAEEGRAILQRECDEWEERFAAAERERDEARAEIERRKAAFDRWYEATR